MLKAYKYRIYPTQEQVVMIDKTIAVCRLVYNLALEIKMWTWQSYGKNTSFFDLCHQLVGLRHEYSWIAEVDSHAVRAAIKNVDTAYNNFFRGCGHPKFKRKTIRGSFRCPCNKREIDWKKSTLSIPKIHNIPIRLSRRFDGIIKTISISKTPTGKYFASILVQSEEKDLLLKPVNPQTTIGLDVGIKAFVATSDGRTFEPNRKFKNNLKRLQCLQKRASRKKKGSSNRKKANLCVAILHEKITNQRTDYIHKVTTQLIRDNQAESFVIENLGVAGMLKNRSLSQALSDVSFAEFFRQLKYKCDWYGKNLITIGRFEPSSKKCSDCGAINEALTLLDREWACASCGTIHDRDLNAAKNIRDFGLKQFSPEGIRVELAELSPIGETEKQESLPTIIKNEFPLTNKQIK